MTDEQKSAAMIDAFKPLGDLKPVKIQDGGQAFPSHTDRFPDGEIRKESEDGMSLRDYFAAKAMQGIVGHSGFYSSTNGIHDDALSSYRIADSMLKARQL